MKSKFSFFMVISTLISMLIFPNGVNAAPINSFSGNEDMVVDVGPIKSPVIVRANYSGEGVFTISPIDSSGKEQLSLFLAIGDHQGVHFQKAYSKPIVAYTVKGTGDWTFEIAPISDARVVPTKNVSGSGDDVVKFAKASTGFKRISFTHDGDGVFSVTPLDSKGRSRFPLMLKIGSYNGTVVLPSGTQYLDISANGNWSFSIK